MIICHCHCRTDRDIVREGPSGPAGTTCGGCRAAVNEVLASRDDARHLALRLLLNGETYD